MLACLCAHTFVKQPNPQGSLSRRIPSSCIESANKQVSAELAASIRSTTTKRKRGPYNRYMPKEKAKIAKYAVQHGTSAALRHFKDRFPEPKLSVVNDWKEAMLKATKKSVSKGQLEKIRRNLLPDNITEDIICYIQALRDAGGVISQYLDCFSCRHWYTPEKGSHIFAM